MTANCLPRRVLFIDDDPMVLKTLAYLLRKAGHDVEEAQSGGAGLALFRDNPADIVLTDFAMPGLTGWDVARTVKSINPRVPVVYVTGSAHEIAPHQREAVEAIIEKPCGVTTLQTVIRLLTGTTGAIPNPGPKLASV
jgi:CheY-like chemotaxis protein